MYILYIKTNVLTPAVCKAVCLALGREGGRHSLYQQRESDVFKSRDGPVAQVGSPWQPLPVGS